MLSLKTVTIAIGYVMLQTQLGLAIQVQPMALGTSKTEILLAQNNYQTQLLNLINQKRKQIGVAPLRFSGALSNAAQNHIEDMVNIGFFDHTGSNGSQPWDRAKNAGYTSSYVGENMAAGTNTPNGAFQQWLHSPGHRTNMLSPNFTEAGIGYILNAPGSEYNHYWVLVLGKP
jgi:uncharacterized protein YkwD